MPVGSKKLCQGHPRYIFLSRRANHFCLVCAGLGFAQYKGVREFV